MRKKNLFVLTLASAAAIYILANKNAKSVSVAPKVTVAKISRVAPNTENQNVAGANPGTMREAPLEIDRLTSQLVAAELELHLQNTLGIMRDPNEPAKRRVAAYEAVQRVNELRLRKMEVTLDQALSAAESIK